MERELPAGLSDAQRSVLSEFFAGHISAGQLTQRLGIEASPQARDSSPEPQSRVHSEVPPERAVRDSNWLRRWLGMNRASEGLLSLAPRRTEP
jgi:hypothetical protein